MKPVFSILALAALAWPAELSAQNLEFYLSKSAMDCIVQHQDAYIAARTYDFAVIFPGECPDVPDVSEATVGNEYLALPQQENATPEQPKAIVVPVSRFECLSELADQTAQAQAEDLLLVDLEACAVSQ